MLKFIELSDTSHHDITKALRIYTESFPIYERKPANILIEKTEKHLLRMFIGRLNDHVVCVAFIQSIINTPYVLLAYLAIDKEYQGKGIGSKFMNFLLRSIREKSIGQYLIMEVENPDFGDMRSEKERRVKFYKRLGAKELKNVRYFFPPKPGVELIEMILMVFPGKENGKMVGKLVKHLINKIYIEIYKHEKDNQLLKSIIKNIPQTVQLV